MDTPKHRLCKSLIALMLVAMFTAAPHSAIAHVPDLEDSERSPRSIRGPEVSRALYGYLAPNEENDRYRFTVATKVTRPVSLLVPAYPEHRAFQPVLTLVADGRIVFARGDSGRREAEWEPFSLTSFWMGPEQEITFEPNVDYELRVDQRGGNTTGRYVVVFGGPESFTAGETLETLGELPLIWFGAYGGAPVRFNALGLVALAVVLAAVAGLVLLVMRLIQRRLLGSRG